MKKHIIKPFAMIAVSLSLASCLGLDETVYSEFDCNNFFKNIDHLQSQCMSLYIPYSRANTWEWNFLALTTMQSSDVMTVDPILKSASIYGIDNTFRSLEEVWNAGYVSINRANTIIKNADRVDGDPDLIRNHIAEAKFMRAWSYYNLVVLFGDIPLHKEPVKDIEKANMPRSAVSEVYDLIVEDLKYACDYLPVKWETTKAGRVTKKAAYTLLGKIYLTMAGYPLMKTEHYQDAVDILEDIAVRPYKYDCDLLPDITDVYDVNKKNNPELLFVISTSREGAMSWGTAMHFYFSGPGSFGIMTGKEPGCSVGWKVGFTQELYDKYEPADDRRNKIWAYSYVNNAGKKITYNVDKEYRATGRGIVVRKYVDTEATSNVLGLNDRIIFRYAETLLLAAEAYANIGELRKSLVMLNKVRARSNASQYTSASFAGKDELLEFIYQERRLELCGEFTEIFDIRRLGRTKENFENHHNKESYQYDDKYLLFPLPSREILYNEAIKDNNPGW